MLDRRGSHVGEDGTRPTRSKSSLSTKRNANMRRRRRRRRSRGYERAAFQNATRLKINRSVDSCYYLSLFLSLSFFLSHFFQHLSIYLLRARTFFHDSIILTSTMKPTISPCREKIFEKNLPILISFFFFLIRPKNEREIYLICIFLRIIVKMFVFIISPYNEQLFIIRNNIRKKRAVISLSILFFFFYNHSVAASKFTTTSFFCMVNIVTLCPCREKYKD